MIIDTRPRPPRLHIPIAVKRAAAKLQGGVCPCGCGTPCFADEKQTKSLVEWDHHPALILRDINKAWTDYIPRQLDPRYIVGRCEASHLVKTSGSGATTAGTDIGARKKERKRLKALAGEPKKTKWEKGRKLCSRNTFKNQKGKQAWGKRHLRRTSSSPSSTGSSG